MMLLSNGRAAAMLALVFSVAAAACGGSEPPPAPPSQPQNPPMKDPGMEAFDEPASSPAPAPATPAAAAEPVKVTAKIESRSGSKLSGEATITETATGVKVELKVEGAGAAGPRGAHVHEKGDCSSADGKSAGDHFNPGKHDHALPTKGERHLGDLGNIDIDKGGKGALSIEIPGANLKAGDPKSFRGRAIIIHEKKDDGGQPTGNAGGRHGCAVIPS